MTKDRLAWGAMLVPTIAILLSTMYTSCDTTSKVNDVRAASEQGDAELAEDAETHYERLRTMLEGVARDVSFLAGRQAERDQAQ